MRPIEAVLKLAPKCRPEYRAAFEAGDALFAAHGIVTPLRLAHFLAQVLHETGGLSIARESGNYRAERILEVFGEGRHSAKVTPAEARKLAGDGPALFDRVYGVGNPRKAKELGNTQLGDGWKYRGHGLMQTTGRANYRRMGEKCGVGFESDPELVLSAEHALKPALAEWTEGKLNAAADADDILKITKRINGGTNGLADRKTWLAKAKAIIDRVDLAPDAPVAVPVPAPRPDDAPKPENKDGAVVATTLTLGGIVAIVWKFFVDYALYIGVGIAALIILILIIFRIAKGRWPWTGRQSQVSSVSSPQLSASSLDQLSARLAQLSAGSPAAPLPEPSVSKPRRKPSARRSPKTRTRSKNSASSKRPKQRKSQPKRKSKSNG